MAATILFSNGNSAQRIVRSQRTFKGIQVGAIRDKGYLVMVTHFADGIWIPFKVIRKRI